MTRRMQAWLAMGLLVLGAGMAAQTTPRVIVPKPRTPRAKSLDPAMFREVETRKAYQIARDNPKLLEKMACYCGCMQMTNEAHTSNYDCFVDNHGAGCSMCRHIALDAQDLQTQGKTVAAIKKEIDRRYVH